MDESTATPFRVMDHPVGNRSVEFLGAADHMVHHLLATITVRASTLTQQLADRRRVGLVRRQRLSCGIVDSFGEPAPAGATP